MERANRIANGEEKDELAPQTAAQELGRKGGEARAKSLTKCGGQRSLKRQLRSGGQESDRSSSSNNSKCCFVVTGASE